MLDGSCRQPNTRITYISVSIIKMGTMMGDASSTPWNLRENAKAHLLRKPLRLQHGADEQHHIGRPLTRIRSLSQPTRRTPLSAFDLADRHFGDLDGGLEASVPGSVCLCDLLVRDQPPCGVHRRSSGKARRHLSPQRPRQKAEAVRDELINLPVATGACVQADAAHGSLISTNTVRHTRRRSTRFGWALASKDPE